MFDYSIKANILKLKVQRVMIGSNALYGLFVWIFILVQIDKILMEESAKEAETYIYLTGFSFIYFSPVIFFESMNYNQFP